MQLIATYRNEALAALGDQGIDFFQRRSDLHSRGVSFGGGNANPDKVSTDISLVWLDRSDPEAHQLADAIMLAVSGCLKQYLSQRRQFLEVVPERSLFVNPIFNLQHYEAGEGFKNWHCDWTTSEDATEPIKRVLAWILYCNDVDNAGTEFLWQQHHVEAVRGQMAIFPAGMSHVHRGRVSQEQAKTIATGWINVGKLEAYVERLAKIG
jgi:hypothetical protein